MNDELLQSFNRVERFHWWWAGRQKLILDFLKNDDPKKILDIGCGTGETITFLKNSFPQALIQGVDLSSEAVKYTKARGHQAQVASALKLPFPDNSFDAVLMLDVIEHIKDDNQVLREAKRIIKVGGSIILTAPSLPFIWSAHDQNQGHFRRYTRSRLIELAKKNSLYPKKLSYFNFIFSPAIIIIRLLSHVPMFGKLGEYDSKLNYQIAYNKVINTILKSIFLLEIDLLKYLNYPFGISIAAKFIKTNKK